MRLAPTLGVTLPALLLSFSFLTPVLGERTAQQIVQDANRLLSEGSYLEASRAYTEAIGKCGLWQIRGESPRSFDQGGMRAVAETPIV
jgi:hypothetical protein